MPTIIRQVVRDYLECSIDPTLASEIPRRTGRLRDFDFDAVCEELMFFSHDASNEVRMAAAFAMLLFQKVGGERTRRAIEVFRTLLNEQDYLLAARALLLLSGLESVPADLIPTITRFLDDEDKSFRIMGACALAATDTSHEPLIPSLEQGLASRIELLVVHSARAFCKLKVRSRASIAALLKALESEVPGVGVAALETLRMMGPKAAAAVPRLIARLRRENDSVALRAEIASILGAVGRENTVAIKALFEAMHSDHWEIVSGAVMGLNKASDEFPKEALEILGGHLRSDQLVWKQMAARSLAEIGTKAAPAVSVLLDQLRIERDANVCLQIANALQSIGSAAFPQLLDAMSKLDHSLPYLAQALTGLDDHGIAELVQIAFRSDISSNVQEILAFTLLMLGPRAASAIPSLIDRLDSDSTEVQCSILLAICAIGCLADKAAPRVIELLRTSQDGEVRHWCERALVSIGGTVTPLLHAALQSANDWERDRIHRVLQHGRDTVTWADFDDDETLMVFVAVGNYLAQEGSASLNAISEALEGMKSQGLLSGALSTSPRQILKILERIEEFASRKFGREVRVTDRRPRQSGSLTKDGRQIIAELNRHVEQLQRSSKSETD